MTTTAYRSRRDSYGGPVTGAGPAGALRNAARRVQDPDPTEAATNINPTSVAEAVPARA